MSITKRQSSQKTIKPNTNSSRATGAFKKIEVGSGDNEE